MDSIMGFSKGDDLKSGGYLETFQAEEGDLLLIRSNCTIYKPQIFFDSNRNGTIDRDIDELIFGEQRFDEAVCRIFCKILASYPQPFTPLS
ncbi:hypothetical protein [Methanothrix soehngenii]|uniref:hypothetical protein n=1 Tax=Methanothrix soehngenii TaxID=2223 RepID=UPI00300DB822